MKPGTIVETNKIVALDGSSKFTFATPKGSRFVFAYMGLRADKNPPIDIEETMRELGWVRAKES